MPEATKLLLLANLALILWTLLVSYFMASRRIAATNAGAVPGEFYVTHNKGAEPDELVKITRHYSNLMENPLLFYAVSAFALLAGRVDMLLAYLACGYVAARLVHSIIHLTVNHVLARFGAFAIALTLLLVMTIKLFLAVLAA